MCCECATNKLPTIWPPLSDALSYSRKVPLYYGVGITEHRWGPWFGGGFVHSPSGCSLLNRQTPAVGSVPTPNSLASPCLKSCSTRQWVQDLHRHRGWSRGRASLLAASLWYSARANGTKFGYGKEPFLTKDPNLLLNNNNAGKPGSTASCRS